MTHHALTTPFGRRTMSLAMAASQIATQHAAADSAVHKWQVFRAICEAREMLGPSDRSLVVLNALLTFLPETVMTPGVNLVVFPSNAQLAARAHGMAPATLRRHLAVLVQTGLIIRRDSPNGKRYARKGREGLIETAYGFDLSPLVARADEFSALAADVAARRRQRQLLRERITIARRDCAKLLETGASHCDVQAWEAFHVRYRQLAASPARSASVELLDQRASSLAALRDDIAAELGKFLKEQKISEKMSGSESQTGRHIQNSDKEILYIEEPPQPSQLNNTPLDKAPSIQLATVLEACPDIQDFAASPINSWRDLHDAAAIARAAMGISPDIWNAFRQQAGDDQAATVIAAILQRRDRISRPGGYLRNLNDRLRAGQFSARPMLLALARKRMGRLKGDSSQDQGQGQGQFPGQTSGQIPGLIPGHGLDGNEARDQMRPRPFASIPPGLTRLQAAACP